MSSFNLGTLYILDLFMRIKSNATRKAVKTVILTFRLASSNHFIERYCAHCAGDILQ